MTFRQKTLTILVVALLFTLIPTGTGMAFLSSLIKRVDQKCTQVVESGLGISMDLGSALYDLQEDGVHGTITALTGVEIPHSYIVVDACGQSLPIDPPVVYNSTFD